MGFKCGIVGLPNVGKSTLFNALTNTAAAEAANYPFCTIEPNVGEVPVPDARLDEVAKLGRSKSIIATRLAFVDIAGLVKGASKGEGLGNQFLGNIREVDAILHVLRCFENDDITHVEGRIDPIADAETIETELMLADMESLQKRVHNLEKKIRGQDKDAKVELELVERTLALLETGEPARKLERRDPAERKRFRLLQLLSAKPVLYVCNVDEDTAGEGNEMTRRVEDMAARQGNSVVTISAAVEAEIAQLDEEEEKREFLESLGLHETGLARVIQAGYGLLDLITFFTVGPKEARAWTVRAGATAPNAAGVIHTDFEKGFIRAETISYEDFVALGGEQAAKDGGKMRLEGKDYVAKDGDIFHFRFAN